MKDNSDQLNDRQQSLFVACRLFFLPQMIQRYRP
jgi:hypothetical protein